MEAKKIAEEIAGSHKCKDESCTLVARIADSLEAYAEERVGDYRKAYYERIDRIAELEKKLEESEARWRNAEDDNIKKAEKLAEYHEANQKRHFRIVELEEEIERLKGLKGKV